MVGFWHGLRQKKYVQLRNGAIAQLAMAYGVRMTWTDGMRAIAQLRRK